MAPKPMRQPPGGLVAGPAQLACPPYYKPMPPLSATTGHLVCPFCRCTFVACVAFYLLTAITGFPDTSTVCLAARPVLHGQAFRVFTAALSHAGLLHLGMNMLAFLPLGEGRPAHASVGVAARPAVCSSVCEITLDLPLVALPVH